MLLIFIFALVICECSGWCAWDSNWFNCQLSFDKYYVKVHGTIYCDIGRPWYVELNLMEYDFAGGDDDMAEKRLEIKSDNKVKYMIKGGDHDGKHGGPIEPYLKFMHNCTKDGSNQWCEKDFSGYSSSLKTGKLFTYPRYNLKLSDCSTGRCYLHDLLPTLCVRD